MYCFLQHWHNIPPRFMRINILIFIFGLSFFFTCFESVYFPLLGLVLFSSPTDARLLHQGQHQEIHRVAGHLCSCCVLLSLHHQGVAVASFTVIFPHPFGSPALYTHDAAYKIFSTFIYNNRRMYLNCYHHLLHGKSQWCELSVCISNFQALLNP